MRAITRLTGPSAATTAARATMSERSRSRRPGAPCRGSYRSAIIAADRTEQHVAAAAGRSSPRRPTPPSRSRRRRSRAARRCRASRRAARRRWRRSARGRRESQERRGTRHRCARADVSREPRPAQALPPLGVAMAGRDMHDPFKADAVGEAHPCPPASPRVRERDPLTHWLMASASTRSVRSPYAWPESWPRMPRSARISGVRQLDKLGVTGSSPACDRAALLHEFAVEDALTPGRRPKPAVLRRNAVRRAAASHAWRRCRFTRLTKGYCCYFLCGAPIGAARVRRRVPVSAALRGGRSRSRRVRAARLRATLTSNGRAL